LGTGPISCPSQSHFFLLSIHPNEIDYFFAGPNFL